MKLDPNEPKEKIQQVKPSKKKSLIWLSTYTLIGLTALTFYILFQLHIFDLLGEYRVLLQKFSLGVFFGILILIASKIIQLAIHKRSKGKYTKYNLIRLTKLLTVIAVAIVIITLPYKNWYGAVVSLGLISLILGFALQTPITSFIGWIYIIVRNPFRIGDRIQIDSFKGDVIQIGYFDTTLWEFGGEYLTNDLPSGRLIRFPNSLVLQASVFNYSWDKFRYIWNEISFQVAYNSDLAFVSDVIKQNTTGQLGPNMADKIEQLKELVKDSPIDEMQIKEYPFISYRISENTWVEVTVTYLVPPRQAATYRTNIIKNTLADLNKEPGKVLFPNGNSR